MSQNAILPYGRQSICEKDIDAVVECLKADFLTQGPRVQSFEKALCEFTGARFAVAVSSGTAALHLAYAALGLGTNDMALVPAITFVATANAAKMQGMRVAFVDVERDTALATGKMFKEVADRIENSGKLLLAPVHMCGHPVDMRSIHRLASDKNAFVVEDASHALGADYRVDGETYRVGQCAHSNLAVTSFHPVKHITTGEGGAILTADESLYERLMTLRSHGIHKDPSRFSWSAEDPMAGPWFYEMTELGYNYRITDIQCALGAQQLTRLPEFLERRRALAARYDSFLAPLADFVVPLRRNEDCRHAYHLYVIQLVRRQDESLEQLALRRKRLYLALRERGILTQVHYIPVPWQPYYLSQHGAYFKTIAAHMEISDSNEHSDAVVVNKEARQTMFESYPGAAEYYAASLSLPLFPAMSDGDITKVVEGIQAWVR
ncbi:MAG: aminotransferase class I/II-fold pyridoxal phosphate-dependent enzyme [Myxococcota bacterium]